MANLHQRRSVLADTACTFELETTFEDNMGSYGNMFDVKTLDGEISIYGMDIYTDVMKIVTYEIYTKSNSFKDDDGKASLQPWTLVKKGDIMGAGRGMGTPIRDFELGNLTMLPNEMRAFYVTLNTSDLRYRDITDEMPNAVIGDTYITNDDLEVHVGVSVAAFPLQADTAFFGKRAWSGRLLYRAERTCAPSSSPSAMESQLPTELKSPAPSRPFDTLLPTTSETSEPTIATLEPTSPPHSSRPSATNGTFEPTISPTSQPSVPDTPEPTVSPTSGPTIATEEPSSTPSTPGPTDWPSLSPSASPSWPPPTSFPTITNSVSPSRKELDDWKCADNQILTTLLNGTTGAYGNMFTVTAKATPIRITTLSFHTRNQDEDVTVLVYTKQGNFVGFENEPRAWRKISDVSLRGAGPGYASKIPFQDFEPVFVFPNQTAAFYITLKTADMLYSLTNSTLGSTVVSNDYLDVNAGVGLADFPFASEFFLYAPRVFNGVVHYSSDARCLPMMNITFSMNINYASELPGSELNRLVADNVEMAARTLMDTDLTLLDYAKNHKVSVDSAIVVQAKGSCKPIKSKTVCVPIDATVTVKHADSLRAGELRYRWLHFWKNITESVNLQFVAGYVGDMPVTSGRIITLNFDTKVAPMTNATLRNFETAIMGYIQTELTKRNVTLLDVQVTGQDVKSGVGRKNHRYLQRDNSDGGSDVSASTIDVSTNINGQYRPPPEIDYPAVIEDAIDAKPQDMEQSLRRADTYFAIMQNTSSKPMGSESQSEVSPSAQTQSSGTNDLLIVLLALLAALLIFVCGPWCWRRRQRKRKKFTGASFVQDSTVLQGKKSLFGGFGKGGESVDAYATADVTWGEGDSMFGSIHPQTPMVPYRDNPYDDDRMLSIVEQFNDDGAYGYSTRSSHSAGHNSNHLGLSESRRSSKGYNDQQHYSYGDSARDYAFDTRSIGESSTAGVGAGWASG